MNAHQSLAAARPIESFSLHPPETIAVDAMVRFEAISKIYPAYRGKPSVSALQDIDFCDSRGSISGVIGRSGAGNRASSA